MVDVETVEEHGVLGGDHIVVVVVRKVHPQTIGRLAGFPVADVVRQDNVELRDVERLAGAEENIGKDRIEQGMGVAARSMEKQDSVVRVSCGIPVGLAERKIVQLQVGERFADPEAEIPDDVSAVLDRPLRVGSGCLTDDGKRCSKRKKQETTDQ
jgi:hypothetical protein